MYIKQLIRCIPGQPTDGKVLAAFPQLKKIPFQMTTTLGAVSIYGIYYSIFSKVLCPICK